MMKPEMSLPQLVLTPTRSKSFCGATEGTMTRTGVAVGKTETGVGVLLGGGVRVAVEVGIPELMQPALGLLAWCEIEPIQNGLVDSPASVAGPGPVVLSLVFACSARLVGSNWS